MIYFGQVLRIVKRSTYHKIVAGCQIGYGVTCFNLRVTENRLAEDLEVGDKILFTGYTSPRSRDGVERFYTEAVFKRYFPSCGECGLPLTSETCLLKHDREAQKLIGQWTIAYKIESRGYIKLYFEKGHFVFAAVSSPKQWIHSSFQGLARGDNVELEGWRYKQSTSLMFIKKLSI